MDTWLVTTKRTGSGTGMDGRVVNDFIWGQGVQTRIKSPYRWSAEVRFLTGRDGIGWTGRIGRFFHHFFLLSGSNTDLVALYYYCRLALG